MRLSGRLIFMKIPFRLLLLACLVPVPGCVSMDGDSGPTYATGAQASSIQLSEADANAIGRKIWQNECAGTVEGLTTWNKGEDFPSLGIGHFIWYVEGRPGPFDESFPKLIQFMGARGVAMPRWLGEANGSPWRSKAEFDAAKSSPQMRELRSFLANTVSHQTSFIVQRLEQALPKMKQATPSPADKNRLHENFYRVASSPAGVYALIDYVNFKGEGIKASESYRGQGWGLRQVLLGMQPGPNGIAAATEFSESAKRVLNQRIANSPSNRGESRWRAGWMNRCETYKRGL